MSARASDPATAVDQEFLDQTFRATLTLLYRLLFLLFAEARDLLPVRETHGYAARSLSSIKVEIADQAGPILDEREKRLLRAYGKDPHSTSLYKRLLTLFRAIDRGDPAVNLPLYDGGLFISDPDPTDDTAEAVAARFLNSHRVPDNELAVAIDLLSRDVDPKRGDLVVVDYKSLGVRHLGSIYEGLLEFRLRVASQRMAIVRGKRTEEILPYREAVRAQRAILREGRGRTAPERTLEAGAVYLENDKSERKATGSYYTPDHIVQYIVQEAVGPALDAHLEHLRARMREAQQAHQQAIRRAQAFQRQGMVGDDPEKVANDPRWIALADEVFEFRVLDPAMGSGHFLVEAVDFITDRLLVFLNGFPWNPVQAALQRTRETIQSELDRQGVSVDATKLNDLNLLKRQVLKRCVYGVDLNPMAVELAKVSLWLDCFTLGAPLSFLDHHLKCGNSLVGVTIGEVERALEVQYGQHYGTLFGGSEFTGIMSAVEMMKVIGGLPDVTPAQVAESRGQFRKASDELAPFKEMLDIYTSRWFGNRPTKTKGPIYDVTVEFLRTEESRIWLKHGTGVQRIGPLQRKAREVAQAAARAHRFFHWQLEFPEVFFGASPASRQVVQLKPDGGFDAVIGNPPYDELSEWALGGRVPAEEFLRAQASYAPALGGRLNWFQFFVLRSTLVSSPGGYHSFIVPMSLMADQFSYPLRQWLLDHHSVAAIEAFPQKDDPKRRVFPQAKLPTCVYVVKVAASPENFRVRTHAGRVIEGGSPTYLATTLQIRRLSPKNLGIPLTSAEGWVALQEINQAPHLGSMSDFGATPSSGEIVFNAAFRKYLSDEPSKTLVLRGAHIQRYEVIDDPKQGDPVYLDLERYLADSEPGSKAFDHQSSRIVYQEAAAIDNWRRIVAAYLEAGNICGHKICYFKDYKCDMYCLLAIFNSLLLDRIVTATSTNNSLPAYLIGALPFPKFQTVPEMNSLADAGNESLEALRTLIATKQVVPRAAEALLSRLARRMVELHQAKSLEQSRFLGWIEGQISGDRTGSRWSGWQQGRTLLREYGGDYQRNVPPLEGDRLVSIVTQAAMRPLDPGVLAAIETEFDNSRTRLEGLTREIMAIDGSIDRIVLAVYFPTMPESKAQSML